MTTTATIAGVDYESKSGVQSDLNRLPDTEPWDSAPKTQVGSKHHTETIEQSEPTFDFGTETRIGADDTIVSRRKAKRKEKRKAGRPVNEMEFGDICEGWTPEGWAEELRRKANACEDLRPDLAKEYRLWADSVAK